MDWPLLVKICLFVILGSVILFCFLVFGGGSIIFVMALKVNQTQEKYPRWQSRFWRVTIHVIYTLISLSALSYLFAILFMSCYTLFFFGKLLPLKDQTFFLTYSVVLLTMTYWLERKILGKAIRSMIEAEKEGWPTTRQSWRKVFERIKFLS
jgi:Ca2+/Na+ antiporter